MYPGCTGSAVSGPFRRHPGTQLRTREPTSAMQGAPLRMLRCAASLAGRSRYSLAPGLDVIEYIFRVAGARTPSREARVPMPGARTSLIRFR